MHLDTVITMVDRDTITAFPACHHGARVWAFAPARAVEDW